MLIRYLLFLTAFLPCARADYRPGKALSDPHYAIRMNIQPETQWLSVKGRLVWPVGTDTLRSFSFFIHRQLTGLNLKGPGFGKVSIDSASPSGIAWLPDAAKVTVELHKPVMPGQILAVDFSYSGRITSWKSYSANALSHDWTEMGLYLPWFPHIPSMPAFTYRIELSAPDNYTVSGLNEVFRTKNAWIVQSEVPVTDMVILASPFLKNQTRERDGMRVSFDYVSLSDSVVKRMTDDLMAITAFLARSFGRAEVNTIHIVQSPRESGGGYARFPGGVVLGGLKDADYQQYYAGYQRYFAHELAHLWWHRAPVSTWEDWINEGFAEYSALMYLGERFGEKTYRKTVESRRKQAENRPPVKGFNRMDPTGTQSSPDAESILYAKAPVILADLDQLTGRDTFLLFCRNLLGRDTVNTREALDVLQRTAGREAAGMLDKRLGD